MKLLFVCTHNRCRSILCEAITRHLAGDRIQACSAGSQPAGEVHPLTLRYLREQGIDTANLCSQSWDDFATDQPDVVITVCDSAASEPCPVWFRNALRVHWGLPDPSRLQGNETDIRAAFLAVMATITQRIQALSHCELDRMSRDDLNALLSGLAAAS